MDNAKRMVLVDEKLLEYKPMLQHFQTKEDLSWKRPTELTVKSSISKQMKSTLDDPEIPEDVKAKRYGQHLNRFLRAKRKMTEEPTVDEVLDIKPEKKRIVVDEVKRKKTKKVIDTKAKRTSKRVSRKPKRFAEIDWENW